MTPEMLQTYSVPIGIGLAIVIVVAVGPVRNAVLASFQQGRTKGENARQALGLKTAPSRPTATAPPRVSPSAPQSFGRRNS